VFARPERIMQTGWESFGRPGPIGERPFATPIKNFYLTNAICRASVTMAQCVEAFMGDAVMKTGTHG
jgi:NADH-quinone oxidoreductase subunit G